MPQAFNTSPAPILPEWRIAEDEYNPHNDAQALILLLHSFHLTDTQIGEAIGMARESIGRLRRDRRDAHPSTVEKLWRLAQSVSPYPLAHGRIAYESTFVRSDVVAERPPAPPTRTHQRQRQAPDTLTTATQLALQRARQLAGVTAPTPARAPAARHKNTPDELQPAYVLNAKYFGRRR